MGRGVVDAADGEVDAGAVGAGDDGDVDQLAGGEEAPSTSRAMPSRVRMSLAVSLPKKLEVSLAAPAEDEEDLGVAGDLVAVLEAVNEAE